MRTTTTRRHARKLERKANRKTGGVSTGTHAPTSPTAQARDTGREPIVLSKIEGTSWEGYPPDADSPFLQRVAYVLNLNRTGVALTFGLTDKEAKSMWRMAKAELPPIDQDEVWTAIHDRVSAQVALGLALREELQRKLADDRKRRAARRLEVTER